MSEDSAKRDQVEVIPLFRQAIGEDYDVLPEPIRALHDCVDFGHWQGRGDVTTGASVLAGLVRRLIGFPPQSSDVPVTVEIRRDADREHWLRNFAGKTFRSEIRLWGKPGSHPITERFGPFRFVIRLSPSETSLGYPVERGWFLGIPIPRWLLPLSDTTETVVEGKFSFEVVIGLPFIGRVVGYKGWLRRG